MQRESIANIRGIAKVLQLSIPTATGAQNKLAHIGIVDEVTGKRRDRFLPTLVASTWSVKAPKIYAAAARRN